MVAGEEEVPLELSAKYPLAQACRHRLAAEARGIWFLVVMIHAGKQVSRSLLQTFWAREAAVVRHVVLLEVEEAP